MTKVCKACAAIPATELRWPNADCAFPDGEPFTPPGRGCGTLQLLRDAIDDMQDNWGRIDHREVKYFRDGDNHIVVIDLSDNRCFEYDYEGSNPSTFWMTWYKDRGYPSMWLIDVEKPPYLPKEGDILKIIEGTSWPAKKP